MRRSTLFAVLALVLSAGAAAAETIAIDQANPPYMYGEKGLAAGCYPALLREAYRRMGEPLTLAVVPWSRALAGLDRGQHAVAGIYQTAERRGKYDYSDRLLDETIVVYVPKARPFAVDGVASLNGKTVGVVRGWSYGEEFDAAVRAGTIRVEEVASDAQNFAKAAAGRIDAVLAIAEAGAAAMAFEGMGERVEAGAKPLIRNPSYVAFAKSAGKAAAIARLNAALAAMRADGTFQRIVASSLAR